MFLFRFTLNNVACFLSLLNTLVSNWLEEEDLLIYVLCISKVPNTGKEACEIGKGTRQTGNYPSVNENNQTPTRKVIGEI